MPRDEASIAEGNESMRICKENLKTLFSGVEDAINLLDEEINEFDSLQADVVNSLETWIEEAEGEELAKLQEKLKKWEDVDADSLRVETDYHTDRQFEKVQELPTL